MPFYIKWIIIAVEAYLLGSLSFSIIVSKGLYKKDIRTFGSGNAGMTNVLRTFGKKAAALTITGDVLKGTVAVLIARLLFAG
ncbi:MAG: glycerol-3-phosphate acyltransferase, partial [Oscillospiraceae bacterium]|nr:glycerol-3-phosphate acyltransferase [Oscillospiraceae bacterium]